MTGVQTCALPIFYLVVWLLGIIGEFDLTTLWCLLDDKMSRRATTTDKKVSKLVGYYILAGFDVLSDGTIFQSRKALYMLPEPSPGWTLTKWHMFEINSNTNIFLAVLVENSCTPGSFIVVKYTLLLPHSIGVQGGIMLHTQNLHGHPACSDYSEYVCTSCYLDPRDGENNPIFPSDMAVISAQLKRDNFNIAWSSWHHIFRVDWPNPFLQQQVVKLVGVPERQSPWDPGGVRFVDIIELLIELLVPWDPGGSHHRLEDKPHFKGARMSCPRGHALFVGLPWKMGRGTWAGPSGKDLEQCYIKRRASQETGQMIETSKASHPFAPVPHLPAICISLLLLILTSNLFSCIRNRY